MKIYAVYYNSDMTEGRGPMVLDSEHVYLSQERANTYVNSKDGVMGRSPTQFHEGLKKADKALVCRGWLCKDCWPWGADWQVRELEVKT